MQNLDPELEAAAAEIPLFGLEDVPDTRKRLEPLFGPPDEVYASRLVTHDLTIGPEDGSPGVRVLVHEPIDRDGTLPGMVWIHGGGFALLNADQESGHSAMLAAELGIVVASVDYRLTPEHPYPAGVNDCYRAMMWAATEGAERFDIDTQRLAVGGRAAGAGLAAAVALMARDRGTPSLCYQHLDIPALDDRLETHSMIHCGDPMWDRERARLSWIYYLADHEGDTPLYAAPGRAEVEDLEGLPPAYVSVCENDCLRDQGIDYAQRLVQAGVPTELHLYPGTFHASEMIQTADVSRRMRADQLSALRRGLRSTSAVGA
jgi:acetyl esterase/lipase